MPGKPHPSRRERRAHAVLIAAVLALGVVQAAPAAADHWEQGPGVEGPLVPWRWPTCDSDEIVDYQAGRMAAELHGCLWQYQMPLVNETDVTYDYWAYWYSGWVAPRRGYCVRKVWLSGQAAAEEGGGLTAHTGPPSGRFARPTRVEVQLRADAAGHAIVEAALSDDVTVSPGIVTRGARRVTWRGSNATKVAMAIGWEAAAPPERYVLGATVGGNLAAYVSKCGVNGPILTNLGN